MPAAEIPGEIPGLVAPPDPHKAADALARSFVDAFGREPEVLAAAPGRVNLIGEHVDYNAGRCLPLALPHATYAAAAPRADGLLRVVSSQLPDLVEVPLDSLRPGSVSGWASYVAGVVWAMREEWPGASLPGVDIAVDGHVPLGAGLSSSAALECAVALTITAVVGLRDDPATRRRLVEVCVRAESEMAGAPTGGMDQSAALLARADHALLLDFEDGSCTHVPWRPEAEGLALLVVDTRVSHELTDGGYAARRADCERAAAELGVPGLRSARGRSLDQLEDARVRRRVRHVWSEMDRVDGVVGLLSEGLTNGPDEDRVAALGRLLDASHASLRDDYEVSCPELDLAVECCRAAGASGARMTGAGFGGSAIALLAADAVAPAAQQVSHAFTVRGWRSPRFLTAPASGPAWRIR